MEKHTAILGELLAAQKPVKEIAFDHGVSSRTVQHIIHQHSLRSMLVLPSERQLLLRIRGKAA